MKIYQFMKETTAKIYQPDELEDTIRIPAQSVMLIMSNTEFEKIKKK